MFPDGLLTPRLQLRPIAPRDARPIFDGYAQDREVTRFLTWRPHTTLSQTEAYVADCMAATSSRTYVLAERSSERVIGALAVRRTNRHAFDVGYVLERPSWGQGLMTEALTEVTRWALEPKGHLAPLDRLRRREPRLVARDGEGRAFPRRRAAPLDHPPQHER